MSDIIEIRVFARNTIECPNCHSDNVKRLGIINGEDLYACEECGKTWTAPNLKYREKRK